MNGDKGVTNVKAYCLVCGELSPATIHTVNGILVRVHIKCEEHKDYLMNERSFVR